MTVTSASNLLASLACIAKVWSRLSGKTFVKLLQYHDKCTAFFSFVKDAIRFVLVISEMRIRCIYIYIYIISFSKMKM